MKKYFRKFLRAEEDGLNIKTETWVSVHETPMFHMCVRPWALMSLVSGRKPGESEYQAAKRKKYIKRIAKQNSRFAFETEDQAFLHLKLLKKSQIKHLKRDLEFAELFVEMSDAMDISEFDLVPDSHELVSQHITFE